jgi:hypothetical protein
MMAQPLWQALVMAQPLQLACQVAVLGDWVLPAVVCPLRRMVKRPQEYLWEGWDVRMLPAAVCPLRRMVKRPQEYLWEGWDVRMLPASVCPLRRMV